MRVYKILVVDDDAAVRVALTTLLEVRGFQVQTASSAPQAIAYICSTAFDVIITDLKMESATAGFDVAEFAAKQNPSPVVIMISAYPHSAGDWKRQGVDAFFQKPTDIPSLLRSINELLVRRTGAGAARLAQHIPEAQGG